MLLFSKACRGMTAQTAVYFTIKHSLSLSLSNKNTDAAPGWRTHDNNAADGPEQWNTNSVKTLKRIHTFACYRLFFFLFPSNSSEMPIIAIQSKVHMGNETHGPSFRIYDTDSNTASLTSKQLKWTWLFSFVVVLINCCQKKVRHGLYRPTTNHNRFFFCSIWPTSSGD